MKLPTTRAFRGCLLGLGLTVMISKPVLVSAQSTSEDTERKVITNEDFRKVLVAHIWTWERSGAGPSELKFLADGTARHTNFVLKYQIKNLHEVEIGTSKGKAKLTFDPTYKTWEGIDFDGGRPIHGKRK